MSWFTHIDGKPCCLTLAQYLERTKVRDRPLTDDGMRPRTLDAPSTVGKLSKLDEMIAENRRVTA